MRSNVEASQFIAVARIFMLIVRSQPDSSAWCGYQIGWLTYCVSVMVEGELTKSSGAYHPVWPKSMNGLDHMFVCD